jgi:hypothetical protein
LRIYGVEKLKVFFDYIYSSKSELFLDRKKQKFMSYFNVFYGARGGRKKKNQAENTPVESNGI